MIADNKASDQLLDNIKSLKHAQAMSLFFQFITALITLFFCSIPIAWIIFGSIYFRNPTVQQVYAFNSYMKIYAPIFIGIIAIGLPAIGILGAQFSQKKHKLYRNVLGSLAKMLPGTYTMTNGLPIDSVRQSHLFPTVHQKKGNAFYVTSYGSIAGIDHDIPIRFSDITVSGTGLSESWIVRVITAVAPLNFLYVGLAVLWSLLSGKYGQHVALRGLLLIAELGTTLSSKTVIVPDRLEATGSFLARVLQNMNMKRDDLVHLENPEFEQLFVTYSTDQIDARKIITLPFMERVVQLRQDSKQEILISVRGKYLYIFLPNKKGFFDSIISKRTTAEEARNQLLAQLRYCTELPEYIGIDHLLKKDPFIQAGLKEKVIIKNEKDIPIINPTTVKE